jgi:transposase
LRWPIRCATCGATWLRSVGYTGRKDPAVLHAHLLTAAPGATGEAGAAAAEVARALVATLTALVTQIRTLDTHIANLLREHADAHIFLSLPRAQALRAAPGCSPRSGTAVPNPSPHWPV